MSFWGAWIFYPGAYYCQGSPTHLNPPWIRYGSLVTKDDEKKAELLHIIARFHWRTCREVMRNASVTFTGTDIRMEHQRDTYCQFIDISNYRDLSESELMISVTEFSWWRHQTETFSALLALFPSQRPVTRSFDVFFNLRPNRRLSKQHWGWWFEMQSLSLWRHRIG